MPSFLGHPRATTILLPPPVYATWNPAGTNPNITLSNGNLTAEVTGPNAPDAYTVSASSGDSFDSGKRYFEIEIGAIAGSPAHVSIGFADSDIDPAGDELGDLQWGYAWRLDGYKENNGNSVVYGSPASAGDVLMLAIHGYIDGQIAKADIWYGVNGIWFDGGNPSIGVGSAFSGAIAPFSTDWGVRASVRNTGDKLTANFGAAAFDFSVPSGFGAGWGKGIL